MMGKKHPNYVGTLDPAIICHLRTHANKSKMLARYQLDKKKHKIHQPIKKPRHYPIKVMKAMKENSVGNCL